ncbi:MAG: hypothetical protein ACKVS9_20275 [Phycisphaerae bacterium]
MIHAFPTHMTPEGIAIAPSRLEYMGIKEGSVCWGLWVEGRGGLRRCQQDREQNECEFQAPHLVLSPYPVDYWATIFTLQILLERKTANRSGNGPYSDSTYGASDALRLCGINILSEQTAQVGYDLIAYNAVCELRDLRPAGLKLLRNLKQALNQFRRSRPGDADSESVRHLIRVTHFQRLGKWIITRLAELQARLVHMDRIRFLKEELPEAAQALMEQSATLSTHKMIADPYDAVEANHDEAMPRYDDPLAGPSFLNEKVIEAGENTYYLRSDELCSRKKLRQAYVDCAKFMNVPPLERAEVSKYIDAFFQAHFIELRNRKLFSPLIHVLSTNGDEPAKHEIAQAVERLKDASEFECWNARRFFRRQSLLPVRILSMPSLAYARFWGLVEPGMNAPAIAFRYEGGLLRPYDAESQRCASTENLVRSLNMMSGLADRQDAEQFNTNSFALVNVHLADRFVRLRFLRRGFSEATCVRLHVTYRAQEDLEDAIDSRGLVAAILRPLVEFGLRAEWTTYCITELTDSSEAGEFEAILKATSNKVQERLSVDGILKQLEQQVEQSVKHQLPHADEKRTKAKLVRWTE